MLKDKVAVIFGAGGTLAAQSRAFAREGAGSLSGRNLRKVEAVAADVTSRGGVAEAAQVDALDEQAWTDMGAVVEKGRTIDISFCAISIAQRVDDQGSTSGALGRGVCLPITTYTQANFLTARSAARRMIARRSGVILTITATTSRGAFPNVGGTAPAYAAVVALTRTLSAELAPQGVRVVCVMPNAMPETATIRDNFGRYAKRALRTPSFSRVSRA